MPNGCDTLCTRYGSSHDPLRNVPGTGPGMLQVPTGESETAWHRAKRKSSGQRKPNHFIKCQVRLVRCLPVHHFRTSLEQCAAHHCQQLESQFRYDAISQQTGALPARCLLVARIFLPQPLEISDGQKVTEIYKGSRMRASGNRMRTGIARIKAQKRRWSGNY